jgi:transcriptional regulator with XRE-family HTH domain
MKNELEKVKEEFAGRLNLAMDEKGYPVRGRARVLSKEFSVSDKGAGKWINGEAIPETSKIPLIAAFLGINTEWLLSGVGEMRPLSQSQTLGTMTQSQAGQWQGNNFNDSPELQKLIELLREKNPSKDVLKHLEQTLELVTKAQENKDQVANGTAPDTKTA